MSAHRGAAELEAWVKGELAPEARDAAKAHLEACAECRARFEALKAVHAGAATVVPSLEPTLVRGPPPPGLVERGAPLGRYLVLGTIGQGSMGAVYAAFDPQLDRKVALKLLSPKLSASPLASERLVREARALARLSHPNVVAVHDVGTVDGRVFIAMQFVDGVTLKRHLAEQRPLLGATLELLIQAGQGLVAAHRAGLVHRDFKPDNVLVAGDGRVQVTDFGLARELGEREGPIAPGSPSSSLVDGSLTATGEVLGTPLYMAPEQLEAKPVDHRADQFSFCVTAFEAFYGERPFKGGTLAQLAEAMRHGPPPPPPGARAVPPHLHAAIARGLSHSPDARFPTMEALLEALSPEAPKRVNVVVVALGAAVLLGVVAGAAWLTRTPECPSADPDLPGAWDSSARDTMREAFTATKSPLAQEAWTATRAVLDRQAKAWAAMQREACEATQVKHTQSEEVWLLRQACLQRRREELAAVVEVLGHADAPMVERATLAAGRLTPIEVCADVELLQNAKLVPEAPAQRPLASALHQRLAAAEAELLARASVDAGTLSALGAEATSLAFAPLEAEVKLLEGKSAVERTQWAQAKAPLFDALVLAQKTGHVLVAIEALIRLVEAEQLTGHLDVAHQWAQLAQATVDPVAAREPRLAARVMRTQAALARRESKHPEAKALAEKSLEMLVALDGEDSEDVAASVSLLGAIAYDTGELQQSLAHSERVIAIRTRVLGPSHPKVLQGKTSLGAVLGGLARFDEGIALLRQNLGDLRRVLPPSDSRVAMALVNLGSLQTSRGDHEAAAVSLASAVETLRGQPAPQPVELANALNNLGSAYARLARFDEGRAAFDEAMALLQRVYPAGDPRLALPKANSGNLDFDQGRYPQALAKYLEAKAILDESKTSPRHPTYQIVFQNIGNVELELGHPAKALESYLVAVSTLEALPMAPEMEADLRFGYARAIWETSRDRVKVKAELGKIEALLREVQASPTGVKAKAWRKAKGL